MSIASQLSPTTAPLREYLTERFPARRLRFVHNARFAETNNVVSLGLALDALGALDCEGSGDVVLTECDLLLDPAVFTLLIRPGIGNAALVDHYRIGMDGTVVSVVGDTVSQVFPPHRQGPDFSSVGLFKTLNVYRFTPPVLPQDPGPIGALVRLLGMLTGLPAHDIAVSPIERHCPTIG
jgi:hypothetical protein